MEEETPKAPEKKKRAPSTKKATKPKEDEAFHYLFVCRQSGTDESQKVCSTFFASESKFKTLHEAFVSFSNCFLMKADLVSASNVGVCCGETTRKKYCGDCGKEITEFTHVMPTLTAVEAKSVTNLFRQQMTCMLDESILAEVGFTDWLVSTPKTFAYFLRNPEQHKVVEFPHTFEWQMANLLSNGAFAAADKTLNLEPLEAYLKRMEETHSI